MNLDLEKIFKEYRLQGMLKNIGDIISDKNLFSSAKIFMDWETIERKEKKILCHNSCPVTVKLR